jgi:predicted component of type VI protein secretion system
MAVAFDRCSRRHAALEDSTMQLQFASLEDRILWHVVRELNHAAGNVGVPNLVQTLSDFGPAAVVRVIEQLQETDE